MMKIEELSRHDIDSARSSDLANYLIRINQMETKFASLESEEPLIEVDWDQLGVIKGMVVGRLGGTQLSLTRRGYSLTHGKHFVMIDPAGFSGEETEAIVTRETELDFGDLPVYSVGALYDSISGKNKHLFLKPLELGDGLKLTIRPIKTTKEPGVPSTGLRFDIGDFKLSLLPELFPLGKAQKDLIAGTDLVVGIETEDQLTLLKSLVDELHFSSVHVRTKKYQGSPKVSEFEEFREGDKITLFSKSEVSLIGGIYLTPPHGYLIWWGKKTLIVKSRSFSSIIGEPLILISGDLAYAVISVGEINPITLEEFKSLRGQHLISESEREEWWPGKKRLYAYTFQIVERYDEPRPVSIPPGIQTFISAGRVEFVKASWGLGKPAYRIFEFGEVAQVPGFKSGKVIVESKIDGLRTKIFADGDRIKITTDPEETETPDKTKRLPTQVDELQRMKIKGAVFDAEAVIQRGNEVLHRTNINALVNGKFDPSEACKLAHIYIFDILEAEGEPTISFPLKERKELLSKFKDSEHIHFLIPAITLAKPALSYLVDVDPGSVKKAANKILSFAETGKSFPKFIAEGVMIKKVEAPYTAPQNKSWSKWKMRFEVDALVVGKDEIIREGKKSGNYTYTLAVGPVSDEWAGAVQAKDKKAVISFEGKNYLVTGRSDNTKQSVKIGSILRIAAEDVNKFETDSEKFPYYKTYVAVVVGPIPEKDQPDRVAVLERLSELTPSRQSFVKSLSEEVKVSVKEGKIQKAIYEKYAEEGQPLPSEFYTDYREGTAWLQTHLRGCEPADVELYEKGKLPFWKVIQNHSVHMDLRMSIKGLPKLVQLVITESDIDSYFRMLVGELRETAGGVLNVQHALVVIKPSAIMEPEREVKKAVKEEEELIIDEAGAKLIEKYQLPGGYWIEPGDVGTSAYKYAWMGLIWRGTVKGGIMRRDYKEYFFSPEAKLPEKNAKFLDGRFVIKCLRRPDKTARWEIWKATRDPKPADPILHKDGGDWYPVKAEDVKAFGKETYTYGRKEPK